MGTTYLGAPGMARVPWWGLPTQVPLSGRSWIQKFSFIVYKFLAKFCSIPRTFISAQKQHHGSSAENDVSPGLVSFKSCKLESKTRGKALGKVDTLETYQGVVISTTSWNSFYPLTNIIDSNQNMCIPIRGRKRSHVIETPNIKWFNNKRIIHRHFLTLTPYRYYQFFKIYHRIKQAYGHP